SKEKHEVHLRLVLELLKKEKLYAKFSKCDFWLQEVHFLGRMINQNGIHVDPSKIEEVKNWKSPSTPSEIRSFLGLAGSEDFVVYCDASNQGFGCVLMQRGKIGWLWRARTSLERCMEGVRGSVIIGGDKVGTWCASWLGGDNLQALSDLYYLFGGFIDYLWSCELDISNFGPTDRKILPVDSCMIKSLKSPKSGNQLRFLIQRVPSGRTSNALSIPHRVMTNALTQSGLIRSFWLKASATTFAFPGWFNPSDQDSLNSAAGGNLLERSAQDVLKIIENKSKFHTSRNKQIVSQVKASNVDSSEIAGAVTSAMTAMFKQHQVTPAPLFVNKKLLRNLVLLVAVLILTDSVLPPMATLFWAIKTIFKDMF
ncbi:hypothetical protein Tco_0766090, partial [Tanacetum coccineum]